MNHINTIMKNRLSDINPGCLVQIQGINGGENLRDKMLSMGLLPGQTIQIISKQSRGPVIIKVNGTRLVLGRGMAEKIYVSLIKCDPAFKE